MKKPSNKQAKKASKLAKAENLKKIHVVFICDEGYILPTCVAIKSLEVNNKGNYYNIHIIGHNIKEESIKKIENLSSKYIRIDVINDFCIPINEKEINKERHVTTASLLKFYIPQILKDINKVIYIDSDTLILKDLYELYNTNISDFYGAVVIDNQTITGKETHLKKLNFKFEAYFNSGVMLLNLALMRENNITDKLIDYRLNKYNHFMDQDAFNMVIGEKVKYISLKYNCLNYFFKILDIKTLEKLHNEKLFANIIDNYRNAVILHLGGKEKPWNINMGYLSDLYKGYANKINWNIKYKPYISIIIPIYNSEKYLKQCLDSVINQTLKEIEIICVDDGSTDSSLEILKEYAKKDDRIIILKQKNSGSAAARNYALTKASGKYIGFIDSDDYIDNNYYEELLKSAILNKADISATSQCKLFKNNKIISSKNMGLIKHEITSIIDKGKIITSTGVSWNKIYNKDFLDKNNIRCLELKNAAEDNYFTDTSIICANKITTINNATYYYRLNDISQTQIIKTKKEFSMIDVYKEIDNFIMKLNILYNDKKQWLEIMNERKYLDFNAFIKSMDVNIVNEFRLMFLKSFPLLKNKLMQLIVSLTSYPARINTVNQTIESILNQSMKADKVILWLAPEQFPNKEKDLPKQLLDLCDKGLTIDWYHDIKSYKKLIPTLKKYPDAIIVTADDDLIYNKNWLKLLYDEYIKNPDVLCAHRTHCIKLKNKKIDKYKNWKWLGYTEAPSYSNFITGGGGVLYPPNSLHKDVLKEDVFIKLCPNADDVWFWAMSVLNNIKIKVAEKHIKRLNIIEGTQDCALSKENVINNKNDEQLAKVLKAYPEVMKKLIKEHKKQRKAEEKNKPSLLKSYLLLPFYLLKIQQMKRVLGKSKPSRVFSVNRYGNKKVYRILGFKFAFNNIKKDVIDNQEKIIKMLNDLTIRQKKLEQECKELRAQLKR